MGLWDIDKIPYVGRQSRAIGGVLPSCICHSSVSARLIVRRINYIIVV